MKRKTTNDIANMHDRKIVMLTAYTAPVAEIVDVHCDIILVGDSVAQVVYGYPSTLQASVGMMIEHGKAVVKSTKRALIVVDMPFGSYEESPEQAFRTASRIMDETGCGAVKLEGGVEMEKTIVFLQARGIPVMGHIGLTPQSVHMLGGYAARGARNSDFSSITADAKAVERAGVFAVVIEGVVERLAEAISKDVATATIGIGASGSCRGQVLVIDDLIGLTKRTAKFVKRYSDMSGVMAEAVENFAVDVREGRFPSSENLYQPSAS